MGYTDLRKRDGDATPGNHLLILEFESQASFENFGQMVQQASMSVTGRSWAEIQEEEFLPLRGPEPVRAETFTAPPGGM